MKCTGSHQIMISTTKMNMTQGLWMRMKAIVRKIDNEFILFSMKVLHHWTHGYFRFSTDCKNFSPINTRVENDSPKQSMIKAGKVFAYISTFCFCKY